MKKRFLLLFATTILVLSSFEVFAQTIGTGLGNCKVSQGY